VAERLRVLIAGWLNSPHVISWAEAVAAAGHEVHLTGRAPPQLLPGERAGVVGEIHPLRAEAPPLVRGLRMSHALAAVAADVAPDLVHAHWLPEFGWMAAREGLSPLVCSAWGSDVFGARGIGRRRSKQALNGSQLVMADSAHLAQAARDLAGRDLPVEVVRWGLNLEQFAPGDTAAARDALGIAHDGPLIVSVRGFKAIYNVDLQLKAFAQIRAHSPEARLLLKYPVKRVPLSVRARIARLGVEDAVILLGDIVSERMADVYRAADVVLSIPSSDSSPRSVWEALACGRPVIVSDLPWARDELTPGGNALLTTLDTAAIATCTERLLEDGALSQRLGIQARTLALRELDPVTCTARISSFYRAVVEATK
jgi:glycosyltransferase involved in cell wall biosynthesis